MPNWCENNLFISGEPKDVNKFLNDAGNVYEDKTKTALCLQKLVPMPKNLEGTTSPGDNPNWYDWRISNWGTKWDVTAELCGNSISFDSAWSPPIKAFEKISKKYPTILFTLEYFEPGIGFKGTATFKDGLINDNEEDLDDCDDCGDEHEQN